jgi:hypothetical protein
MILNTSGRKLSWLCYCVTSEELLEVLIVLAEQRLAQLLASGGGIPRSSAPTIDVTVPIRNLV